MWQCPCRRGFCRALAGGLELPRAGADPRPDARGLRVRGLRLAEDDAKPRRREGVPRFGLAGVPDLRFEPDHGPFVNPTERPAAFYWRGYATHTGPLDPPGLAPTGRRIQPEGGDFHEYRDGKLARVRIVFDVADTMRQLGVLPATGGREEHLITRLAGLRAKLGRRR
jgi:SnoaL-like polyketide cyclase